MSAPSRSLLQCHVAVLLFSPPALFGKLLPLSPVVIVFGRVALAAAGLLCACALCKLPLRPPSRRGLVQFFALGVLLAIQSLAFFQAVQVSGVAIALVSFSTFPVFVAFLEPLLLGERMHARDVALAAVALAGVAILMPRLQPGDSTTQGVLWGVLSGLSFALLSLLNRRCAREHSGMVLGFYQAAFAALILLPFVVVDCPVPTARDIALLLVLGIVCTAVAHSLFIVAMRGIKARSASMIACLEPLYGSAFAAVILREIPSLRTLIAASIVLAVALYASVNAGR